MKRGKRSNWDTMKINPSVFQRRLADAFRKYTNLYPSSPLAMHFTRHQHEIQKATAGPWTQMNGLLQLDYSVFSDRDMAKKAEHTQRNMQRLQ